MTAQRKRLALTNLLVGILGSGCHSTTTIDQQLGDLVGEVRLSAGSSVGLAVTLVGPSPRNGLVEADGKYRFDDLAIGLYRICVLVPSSDEEEACAAVEVTDQGGIGPTLEATTLGEVAGQVFDGAGRPLAGVWLGAAGEAPAALSDGEGKFLLRRLRVGTREFFAVKAGFLPLRLPAQEIVWNQPTDLGALHLAANTQPLSLVTGRIELLGAPSPQPISLRIDPIGVQLECDDSGHFATMLPAGVYSLTVSAPRRSLTVERLLVGDGHAYLVDEMFRPLEVLRLPIGERQPSNVVGDLPQHDATVMLRQLRLGSDGKRGMQVFSLPDRVLRFEFARVVANTWEADGKWLYHERVRNDQAGLDLMVLDLDSFSDSLTLEQVAIRLSSSSLGGSATLAWNTAGTLFDVASGQPIVSVPPGAAVLPGVTPIDASSILLAQPGRVEVRGRLDGSLEASTPASSFVRAYRADGRLFLLDGADLFSVSDAGANKNLVASAVVEVTAPANHLLYRSNAASTLLRPSDGWSIQAKSIRAAPRWLFVSDEPDVWSVRALDAPEIEVRQLHGNRWVDSAADRRFVLFGQNGTDLGADWIAFDTVTGKAHELGFARQVTAHLQADEPRFFLLEYLAGSGSSGRLRERLADGSDRVLATDIHAFSLSPQLDRVALTRAAADGTELWAKRLGVLDDPEELLGRGVPTSAPGFWISSVTFAWRTNSGSSAVVEPGYYHTTFSP